MGTRADFYVGRGVEAEWLGSFAFDGYPTGFDSPTGRAVLEATDEPAFRAAVTAELASRDDSTVPEQGWPWPWATSAMTDYAYAFDGGTVWASCYGSSWWPPSLESENANERVGDGPEATFPDMTDRQNVVFGGHRSGMIIIGPGGAL